MDPQPSASQLPPNSSKKPLVAIITLAVLLVVSLVFGYSSYSKGQDYKKNSDAKSATAVAAAKTAQAAELQAAYNEQSKSPYKTFQSSSVAGSVTFYYPKTWSAYVDETATSSQLINAYFYPNQVPGISGPTAFALRVEMVSTDYSQIVTQLTTGAKKGTLSASAYVPPQMVGAANVQTGTRFDGALTPAKSGSMVVMKVRDKTLKIYTESKDYLPDFNNTILSSLKFSP